MTTMYCKDCVFNIKGRCENTHIRAPNDGVGLNFDDKATLTYSCCDGGYFRVADHFGCVHFKGNEAYIKELSGKRKVLFEAFSVGFMSG